MLSILTFIDPKDQWHRLGFALAVSLVMHLSASTTFLGKLSAPALPLQMDIGFEIVDTGYKQPTPERNIAANKTRTINKDNPGEKQKVESSQHTNSNGHDDEYVPPSPRRSGYSNPRPHYPLSARRRGMEGRVILLVWVNTDGNVHKIDVKQSSGFKVLDSSAIQAVRQWRFSPALRSGKFILSTVEIPIRFELEANEFATL